MVSIIRRVTSPQVRVGYGLGYTKEAVGSRYAEQNLPNRVDLKIVGAYSTRRYYRAGFDLAFRNLGGSFINMGIRGQSVSSLRKTTLVWVLIVLKRTDRTTYIDPWRVELIPGSSPFEDSDWGEVLPP